VTFGWLRPCSQARLRLSLPRTRSLACNKCICPFNLTIPFKLLCLPATLFTHTRPMEPKNVHECFRAQGPQGPQQLPRGCKPLKVPTKKINNNKDSHWRCQTPWPLVSSQTPWPLVATRRYGQWPDAAKQQRWISSPPWKLSLCSVSALWKMLSTVVAQPCKLRLVANRGSSSSNSSSNSSPSSAGGSESSPEQRWQVRQ